MAARLGYSRALLIRNTISLLVQNRGIKRWLNPTLRVIKKRKEAMGPQPPVLRSSMAEWNYNAELFAFSKRLSEDFDLNLLQQALTTREFVINEIEKQKSLDIVLAETEIPDNRSMIVSGDKIINNYIPRYLRTVFPTLPEEGICAVQEYLTSEELLALIGSNIGLADLILAAEMPPNVTTISKAMKAIISCLAECSGLDRANLFVRDFILTHLAGKNINDLWPIENPIGLLSDILERDGRPPFEARLIGESGKSTILANYQVGLYVNKQLIGVGFGESIPTAKQMSARDALQKLFNTTESMKPVSFDLNLKSDISEPFANLSIQDWCVKNADKLKNRA